MARPGVEGMGGLLPAQMPHGMLRWRELDEDTRRATVNPRYAAQASTVSEMEKFQADYFKKFGLQLHAQSTGTQLFDQLRRDVGDKNLNKALSDKSLEALRTDLGQATSGDQRTQIVQRALQQAQVNLLGQAVQRLDELVKQGTVTMSNQEIVDNIRTMSEQALGLREHGGPENIREAELREKNAGVLLKELERREAQTKDLSQYQKGVTGEDLREFVMQGEQEVEKGRRSFGWRNLVPMGGSMKTEQEIQI